MSTVTDGELPIASLVPNPRNPRRHPEDQVLRLMASLSRDGQTKPIVARKENGMLIAGHGVREAALKLGWTSLSVRLLDVDQATADRIMLADNRFSDLSTLDEARVADLLRDIDNADWMATGFSSEEIAKMMAGLDQAAATLTVTEIDTKEVRDIFWISVRGPLAEQAEVLQRIKQLLGEYSQITVELGIVERN